MSEAIHKFIRVLATQVPLFGGVCLKWNQAQQRPLVAAAIALLYELAVVTGAVLKKVWTQELEKDAIKAMADGVRAAIKATMDWVLAAVRNLKPGFRRRYNREIIHEYGVFNVRGLGLINTFTLKLDQVFVDLRIAPSANPRKASADLIAVKELPGNRPIWEFLRMKRGRGEPAAALAVIGPPGCGKTTLLQHVALTLAANRQRRHRLHAYTPVLLFLRDHVAAITDNPDITLGALAEGHARKQFQRLKPPPDWFERQLNDGKCLMLLDGLDEVADREKRVAMSLWVDRQIRDYEQCPFIVSSRPQGYLAAPLDRAHIVEVQPFNSGQVRSFVDNWYLANEIVASGKVDNEEVRRRAQKDADDLLERLKKLPTLGALTVNPLLLTMIAMVHRYHGALPGSRVELYNEICEVLLGRWRQAMGVKDNLTAAQKRSVLQPLAAKMMKRRLREISADDAAEIIRPLLASVGVSNDQAKTALSDFQASSGLLLEREAGQWSFAHLTFQEFLTSAHWLEDRNAAPDWNEIVGDSWWHETLRLYAAQGDATGIANACLASGSVPALTLAFECAVEARKIDAAVRAEINARLIEGLESDDQELRRIAAEVRLARRLKSLQRIDDKREIDLTYITCAEYQLFLDDMSVRGEWRQPDHWTDFTFTKGQAHEPVCGVRHEDAEEFCKWLTERQGGKASFRLPSASEARKWDPDNTHIAVWCGDQQAPVGLTPKIEQELRRKLKTLAPTRLPMLQLVAFDRVDTLDFVRVRVRAIAFARALGLTRGNTFGLDLDLDSVGVCDLNDAHAHVLASAQALASAAVGSRISTSIHRFIRSIEQRDFGYAQRLVEDLMNDSNSEVARWGGLLSALLAVIAAENSIEMRAAQKRCTACIFEYVYEGYEILENEESPWRQKMLGIRGGGRWKERKRVALDTYWRLQIGRLRVEGKLEAWEGIRIVREQVDS